MKPLKFIFLFALAVGLWTCQKPDDNNTPCTTPEYNFWVNPANNWLLQPIKIGDTVTFKVYFKDKANGGRYIYRRDAQFFISDSLTQKLQIADPNHNINCNDFYTNNNRVVNLKGPTKLEVELEAGQITKLGILFQGKIFEVGNDQYVYHLDSWHDSIMIGGQEYYSVKDFFGVNDDFSKYYVDSTYCSYNLQYGILKLEVNDTLIYLRKPH